MVADGSAERRARRERAIDATHLRGIVVGRTGADAGDDEGPALLPGADLLRPLAEYEQVAGGGW